MFGRPLGFIAQEGAPSGGSGPTSVAIESASSLAFLNACKIARCGSAIVYFEDGSNFSGGGVSATVSAGTFNSARDRSIGFAAYGGATTSGGGMTFDWTITEVSAFPSGALTSDAENTAQDLTGLALASPPNGQPDPTTGIGPYVVFSGAPSVGDAGKYSLELDVTDSNGTTSASTLTLNIEFIT